MSSLGIEPLFDKYSIDSTYTIRRTNSDGSLTVIDDSREREKLLDTDFFRGSIAFSRDVRHVTAIHKIIFVFQKILALLTRRLHTVDANICHGMVIVGKGIPGKKGVIHPFIVAEALFDGVQTRNADYLQDKDVTNILIYRPRDEKLRDIFQKNAYRTAIIKKKEYQPPGYTTQKHEFSLRKMATSFLFNRKHRVCGRYGAVPESLKRKTASIVADMLQHSQPLDREGNLDSFFCTSYASTILQGSIIMRALDDVDEEVKKKFCSDSQGITLHRDDLIKKIQLSFDKQNQTDPVSQRLHSVYTSTKLARFDAEFTMSAIMSKKLDKLSVFRLRT